MRAISEAGVERLEPAREALAGHAAMAGVLEAELARSLAADPSLPGIMASVSAPRLGLEWSGAVGTVSPCGEPLTAAHGFRVASITKPFTSAVALRLHENGLLALFAPIAPLLDPDVAEMLAGAGYDPLRITPYHLLTHASGLRDHTEPPSPFMATLQHAPGRVWSHNDHIAACMALGPPRSEPGTHFAYSDTGYLILGQILEAVGGAPLHRLMREVLDFAALGLVHTHFERHEIAPPGLKRAWQRFGEADVAEIDCSADLSGGGGLVSTTGELVRFMRAAASGALFRRADTRALALFAPSLHHNPPVDALHSALMRCRMLGREPSFQHGCAWGAVAGWCPASDFSLAVSHNQLLAGESTTGVPGDPARPSLADRLALIVQRASGDQP